jgi:DNA-binding SARP family transcriptional activator
MVGGSVETHDTARAAPADDGLEIRLLGELRVSRGGVDIRLPASKRTRALLGHLVATAVPHSRQALCDLLWDGPDDPRAELRWSLSKLRPVLDVPEATHIEADRERVAFVARGATVDVVRAQALLAAGVASAELAALEQAAALLSGEFLDGLDLPACHRYHQWCMAEREAWGRRRVEVLGALTTRLADRPDRALPFARSLVAADPFSESAHAGLVRLLVATGRASDAEAHCRQAELMFRRELGVVPSSELREAAAQARLEAARRPERSVAVAVVEKPVPARLAPASTAPARGLPPLVGRAAERAALEAAIDSLDGPGERGMLVLLGEPGIGKTRLLELLCERALRARWRVLRGRCFEAEMVRPYGSWIDALRAVPPELVPDSLVRDLAPLQTRPGPVAGEGSDRARLFVAAAGLVEQLAAQSPVLLVLDDLQWLDEGSASLLHYVVRSVDPATRWLVAGAARRDEIDENPVARQLLHSLEREGRLRRFELGPLAAEEVAALLAAAAPGADAAAAYLHSGGNPLFALALAQSGTPGDETARPTWQTLAADLLRRLDDAQRDVLVWAAAMGREFRVETLAAALDVSEVELLARLGRLERRGLLHPTGAGHYDFAHDLVRDSVYRDLSQPHRRALHRRISRVLAEAAAADPALHGEVAHHAAKAGDALLTVRACTAAAEHCLRVFANDEAVRATDGGLAAAALLPAGADRVTGQIALLRLRVIAFAGRPAPGGSRSKRAVHEELQQAVQEAEWLGLHAAAASGLHILSWLTQQANDLEGTRVATLRAEAMSRRADGATHCWQAANTGRCLLEVESEVVRARELLDGARVQSEGLRLRLVELEWGHALLARWDGDLDAARAGLVTAVGLARLHEDRWRELECLVWLAKVEFERESFDAVDTLCAEAAAVAARMGDVAAPLSAALPAIAAWRRDPRGRLAKAPAALAASLADLRSLDDKAQLAYALNQAASVDLDHGDHDAAAARAKESLAAAEAVGRATEIVVARALLACAAAAQGRRDEAAASLQGLSPADAGAIGPSARARQAIARAERALQS